MIKIENQKYEKVKPEDLDCPLFMEDIVGYTGEKFCDRPVVLFRQRPGVFGSYSVQRAKIRKYTLHNKVLNQCCVHGDGRPGVYWAVIDAMSDKRDEFTRDDIVDAAVATLVKNDGRFKANAKTACTTAFYIIKTHMSHPARRGMGYGFVIEKIKPKVFKLRARKEEDKPKVEV